MRTSLAVSAAALMLLSGCGWLGIGGGDSTTTTNEKVRPGAERSVSATNTLPGARGAGQYDASFVPVDETRNAPKIGSVVQGKGGQKAQKEAADKDAQEREARSREERARAEREASLKKAQEGDKGGDKKPAATTDAAPPAPAANAGPQPAPAPVSSAPLAPPPAAPPAPASDTRQ